MQFELLHAIANTLSICAITTLVAVPLGAYLAVMLTRSDLPGRGLAWMALASQLAVPLYVFAGGWSAALGTQGWLRAARPELLPLGVPSSSLFAVAFIHALAAIPWVTLIVSLGLMWTDRGQEETALTEGGSRQLIRRVWLPRLRIWLTAAALWCCLPILTEMVVTNLYQVTSVAEQIYLDATRGTLSAWTYLAAVWLCMFPILLSAWLWMRCAPAWKDVVYRAAQHRPQRIALGGWRLPLCGVTHAIVAALVLLPMLSLIAKAGWTPSVDAQGLTRYGWSPTRFLTTVDESLRLFGAEFYWSLLLASASTAVSIVVAGGLLGCLGSRARPWASGLMCLLVSVPGPLAGMLVIQLLNRSQPAWLGWLYDNSLAAPILAQQFRMLPLAWLLLLTLVATVDQRTWDMLQLEGLSRRAAGLHVLWPQLASGLFAISCLLLVVSVGELSCSILVLPPGVTTVSMRLFEMLHFGMRHQDSGLCGVLLLLGWATSLSIWKTLRDR